MNLRIALVGLLAVGGGSGYAAAFAPRSFGMATPHKKTTASILSKGAGNPSSDPKRPDLWRPPMNMVAGGAERAYGDEYYDGKAVPCPTIIDAETLPCP